MSLTKSTGTHTPSNDPRFDRPFELEGESDILEVTFYCEGEIVSEYEEVRYIPYSYLGVNDQGVEVSMIRPQVTNCYAIDDDINTALRKIFGRDYTINYMTQTIEMQWLYGDPALQSKIKYSKNLSLD